MAIAVVIIPAVLFAMGGPSAFVTGLEGLTLEQQSFFSKTAFLEQGAPFFFAVLAYAIGNQTISQRLFAVDKEHIKSTFITATLGRSEEHTSELQSRPHLVCRLLLEK